MVKPETLLDWTGLLRNEACDFSARPTPERAKNILVLAECVKAAATGYLIKQKMEGVINGKK